VEVLAYLGGELACNYAVGECYISCYGGNPGGGPEPMLGESEDLKGGRENCGVCVEIGVSFNVAAFVYFRGYDQMVVPPWQTVQHLHMCTYPISYRNGENTA
jgi:hypothetical protein